LTEIPEHLLARSKQRRAAISGEGDAPSSTPATTASSTPAPAASDAAPAAAAPAPAPVEKAPEPTPPWVEAAETRKKVPVWVIPVLVAIVPFFIVYALTNDKPTSTTGPLAVGATVYSTKGCSGCHGASGGGASGPAMAGGAVVKTFPDPAEQVAWVAVGSEGWAKAGNDTYGATNKPVNAGAMPAWQDSLSAEELMAVVLHERVVFGGEDFDWNAWDKDFDATLQKYAPDKAEEYRAVLDAWKTTPPTA
jgi:hypothetical protein